VKLTISLFYCDGKQIERVKKRFATRVSTESGASRKQTVLQRSASTTRGKRGKRPSRKANCEIRRVVLANKQSQTSSVKDY